MRTLKGRLRGVDVNDRRCSFIVQADPGEEFVYDPASLPPGYVEFYAPNADDGASMYRIVESMRYMEERLDRPVKVGYSRVRLDDLDAVVNVSINVELIEDSDDPQRRD